MTKTGENEKKAVFEMGAKLSKEETYDLKFSEYVFTVRFLTSADMRNAEKASLIPGGDASKPKYDMKKQGEQMVISAIKGWQHISGATIVENGEPLKVNPENVIRMLEALPGLGSYIINRVSNADKMYRTLSGEDVKN